jgi:hypothetical protein
MSRKCTQIERSRLLFPFEFLDILVDSMNILKEKRKKRREKEEKRERREERKKRRKTRKKNGAR